MSFSHEQVRSGSNPSRFHWLQEVAGVSTQRYPNLGSLARWAGRYPCRIGSKRSSRLLRSWLTSPCPPRLVLLALLPPALGAQLLVAHDAAEALTGAQLRPAA